MVFIYAYWCQAILDGHTITERAKQVLREIVNVIRDVQKKTLTQKWAKQDYFIKTFNNSILMQYKEIRKITTHKCKLCGTNINKNYKVTLYGWEGYADINNLFMEKDVEYMINYMDFLKTKWMN